MIARLLARITRRHESPADFLASAILADALYGIASR